MVVFSIPTFSTFPILNNHCSGAGFAARELGDMGGHFTSNDIVSTLFLYCITGNTGIPGRQQGTGEGPGCQGPLRKRSYEEVACERLPEDIHPAEQQ